MQQRGIAVETVRCLLLIFDRDVPVGGGCSALSVSHEGLASMASDGAAPDLIDRVKGIVLVVNEDGEVVTIQHDRGGVGRRYRRQW
ncbi:MAG: hypothetical protein AB7S71_14610 [Dongiaceae bacterium]